MNETKELAFPMTISLYPREKDALLRIMREQNLKSSFDVVRLFAAGSRKKGVRPEDFGAPKKKS